MYNIVPHHIRNEAIMLQNFRINSPYGSLGKHPPQGRWEDYVEKFQYIQELDPVEHMRVAFRRARACCGHWGELREMRERLSCGPHVPEEESRCS
jgi:hypothetical protein